MAQPVRLADVTLMSIDDRIALAQAIWDSIADETDQFPLTDQQRQTLDRRIAELDAQPQNVLTWEQIKGCIRERG